MLCQHGLKQLALLLKCIQGLLGFGWGAGARRAEALYPQRGCPHRLRAKEDYRPL